MPDPRNVSSIVSQQLPLYLQDNGATFVEFIKTYYQWMEQGNNVIDTSRQLRDYDNIDLTPTRFVEEFQQKYIQNLPNSQFYDARLIIKHASEIHRAKGNIQAYKLLFRMLYNDDIEIYLPSENVFKPSDGIWTIERYLQAAHNDSVFLLIDKQITGQSSGATAVVENVRVKIVDGKSISQIILSNINGEFQDNEIVASPGIAFTPPIIAGINRYDIVNGGGGFNVGDIVDISGSFGEGAIARITTINDVDNTVIFTLVEGGSGYAANAVITVAGGGGTGADFIIGGIINPEVISFATDTITPYAATLLNAADYGFPPGGAEDKDTALQDALSFDNATVGTIDFITQSSGGTGYTSNPVVSIVQPDISDLGLDDGSGGVKGLNAVVTAGIVTKGSVETIVPIDSGLGYVDQDLITYSNDDANTVAGTATITLKGAANSAGRWIGTESFPSYDQFIQDSLFYQEYSYQIRASESLESYRDVVETLMHPAGVALFGRFDFVGRANTQVGEGSSNISIMTTLTGTANVVLSNVNITGVSTLFTSELAVDDIIDIEGERFTIVTIANNHSANVNIAWPNTTGTGKVIYKIG